MRLAKAVHSIIIMMQFYAKNCTILAFLVFCLSSCIHNRINQNLNQLQAEQEKNLAQLSLSINSQQKTIRWPEAYRMMCKNNLALRQSATQLRDIQRQHKQIWLELVPNVNMFANLNSSITELANLQVDRISSSIVAGLNIPNPFQLYARLYSNALQLENAIISHEIDKRRAYIELYTLFLEQNQISVDMNYDYLVNEVHTKDPFNDFQNKESARKNTKLQTDYQRLRVNQILNTPGENWKLEGGLPEFSYQGKISSLKFRDRFGLLGRKLQILQIEAAQMSVRQIKFQRWPNFNFGASVPSLYNSSRTIPFNGDNILFYSGVFKTFDLSDPLQRENLRDADERLKFTLEQQKIQNENEIANLERTKASYIELSRQILVLRESLDLIKLKKASVYKSSLKNIKEYYDTTRRLNDAMDQIKQIELQLLLWDEDFWN